MQKFITKTVWYTLSVYLQYDIQGLNIDRLKAEYQELTAQKKELTATYKNCEKELKSLNRKLENLNQYLGRTEPQKDVQEQPDRNNTPVQ